MGRWRLILVQLLVISAGAVAQVVELDKSDVPVDVESGVQQIHIAQGIDPTTMVISWLTPNYTAPAPASQVRYGLDPDNLDWLITNQDAFTYTIPAGYAKQDQKSPYPDYTSGWLHNVELRNLQPNTLYYYQCGDFSILPSNGDDYPYTPPTGRSGTLFFKTLPAVGKKLKEPLVFGMVADIGQNPDAQRSVLRLSQNDPALILIVGDDGYADCVGTLWDSFLNMLTGVSSFV